MDPILSAKSSSMADAFTMLLAIQQGPKGPSTGRIYKRAMLHNHYPFHQFYIHEKEDETRYAKHAARWVSVEFRQWDGFFYLYTHKAEDMKPYLPHKKGHVQQGFNFARFTDESRAYIYSIDQIEQAARHALGWLISGQEVPGQTDADMRTTLTRVMNFKNYHRTGGKVYLNISDLGKLLEK